MTGGGMRERERVRERIEKEIICSFRTSAAAEYISNEKLCHSTEGIFIRLFPSLSSSLGSLIFIHLIVMFQAPEMVLSLDVKLNKCFVYFRAAFSSCLDAGFGCFGGTFVFSIDKKSSTRVTAILN